MLTVKGLEGEAIESFALRVAEAWQVGDAQRDDGAILIVAAEDRRARIEVGYGLEGAVPDALAARILREQMIPRFRVGEMGAGVRAGALAVMAAARGEVVPGGDARGRRGAAGEGDRGLSAAHAVLLAVLLGAFVGGNFGRRRRGIGSLVGASISGVLAFVLTVFLPAAIFAALAGLVLSFAFSGGPPAGGLRGGPRGWGSGGPVGGWGGGFGGGGFGGGGFGGGGGGFGGGGASGNW